MNNWKVILSIVGLGAVAALLLVWFVFSQTATPPTATTNTGFGESGTKTTTTATQEQTTNTAQPVQNTNSVGQKITKIAEGPIAGAVLLQTGHPTTTVARYVLQSNGHVMEVALDSPGAIPKALSNTTVPGIAQAFWSERGAGVLVQYLDGTTVKTAHISLPTPGSTTTPLARIQFLPNSISSLAVAPDGSNIAYVVKTQSGADIFIAKPNGGGQKLTSLPLSQIALGWPAPGTLLVQSAAASGVAGIALAIDTKSGASSPILFGAGLTAIADRAFAHVVYQTSGDSRTTYSYTIKTGIALPLVLTPMPEQCAFGNASSTVLYCGAPYDSSAPPNYPDLWRMGTASYSDALLSYNLTTGARQALAVPGSTDGGQQADFASLTLSPDDHYAAYVRKGDRSLWTIRLTN